MVIRVTYYYVIIMILFLSLHLFSPFPIRGGERAEESYVADMKTVMFRDSGMLMVLMLCIKILQ